VQPPHPAPARGSAHGRGAQSCPQLHVHTGPGKSLTRHTSTVLCTAGSRPHPLRMRTAVSALRCVGVTAPCALTREARAQRPCRLGRGHQLVQLRAGALVQGGCRGQGGAARGKRQGSMQESGYHLPRGAWCTALLCDVQRRGIGPVLALCSGHQANRVELMRAHRVLEPAGDYCGAVRANCTAHRMTCAKRPSAGPVTAASLPRAHHPAVWTRDSSPHADMRSGGRGHSQGSPQ
jgi:hypothetical protein